MNLTDGHMRLDLSSDADLVRAAALGRQDALKILMDRFMPMVYRISYRILCDRQGSEGVTRNTFIMMWKNASSYDGRYSVTTWICGIIYNLCSDSLRKQRFLSFFSITPAVYETSAPVSLSSEDDFCSNEIWSVFCRVSQELSVKQRTIFTLRELERLPFPEVSSITGMTADHLKSTLRIARKKVRQEIDGYGKLRKIRWDPPDPNRIKEEVLRNAMENTEMQTALTILKRLTAAASIVLVCALCVGGYGYFSMGMADEDERDLWTRSRAQDRHTNGAMRLYEAYEHSVAIRDKFQ